MSLAVHPLTENPTAAWDEISQRQKVIKINAKTPNTEAPNDKVCVRIKENKNYYLDLELQLKFSGFFSN